MPIYEYECKDCGHQLSRLQKLADAPLTLCPACDAQALVKLLSVTGFRLRGNGWHETDFKVGTRKNNLAACDFAGSCPGCPAADN